MKPSTNTATVQRPNRVLIALAAAWMILSLAIGGVASAQPASEAVNPVQAVADEAARH